jgi:sugar phosphate isomerase/epimerase
MRGDDLVLLTGTIGNPAVDVVCAAAVAGGFSSVATWPVDVTQHMGSGRRVAEYRHVLADAGVTIDSVDGVFAWAHPYSTPRVREHEEHWWLGIAAELGARCVGAYGHAVMPGVDELSERFAQLCDRAREHGLSVGIEPAPWISLSDPAAALAVWERAGWPDNGGVLLDSWHFFRGCVELESLARLPARSIVSVQLADGEERTLVWSDADLLDETMHHRLLPGDGEFDLEGFVGALDEAGAEVPIVLEVLNDELRACDPVDAARRMGAAAKRVIEAAQSADCP